MPNTHALKVLLGIELPIIQAPMAGVQGSALALTVSNAVGLGSLPCAMLDTAALRSELAALAAGSAREPFGDAAAQAIETVRPAVVSFHFGLPSAELLARVHALERPEVERPEGQVLNRKEVACL